MDFIRGYKKVSYIELQTELNKKFETSNISYPELAVASNLNSTAGVKNSFDVEEQKVSDKVLTSIFNALGFKGFIIWYNGERNYFIAGRN